MKLFRPVWLVSLPCLIAVCAAQTPTPMPVEQEPFHHVVLKNADIVVMHVTLPRGDSTAYHIHSCDRAGVELSNNTSTSQKWGESEGKPSATVPGDVFSDSCDGKPLTHRVHNVGTTTKEVIDLELLNRPATPSSNVAGPVAIENPSARVYKWVIAPGTATAMHTHTRPYLIVVATPMQLKMTAPGGQFRAEQVKAGDFHWVNVPVTHSLANEGSTEGTIVEFELK